MSTREEPASPRGQSVQSSSFINYPPQASPAYSNSSLSDGYPVADPRPGNSSSNYQPQSLGANNQGTLRRRAAIPTLRVPHTTESSKSFKKRRTAHACDNCRKVKAGCGGGQPCSRCKMTKSICFYGDRKREREKKEISNLNKEVKKLSRHNSDMREALWQVRHDSSLSLDEVKLAIDVILQINVPVRPPVDRVTSPMSSTRRSSKPWDITESRETIAGVKVGSSGALDVVGLHTDRYHTSATGYMGGSSAVTLQQRAADEISGHEPTVATRLATMVSSRVSNLPTEAPVPSGYRTAHFNAAGQRTTPEVTRLGSIASGGPRVYLDGVSTGLPPRWNIPESAGYSSFDTTFAPKNVPEMFQVASNPLDTSTTAENFFSIRQLHGHSEVGASNQ